MVALLLTILWYPDLFSASKRGTERPPLKTDVVQHEASSYNNDVAGLFSSKQDLDQQETPPAVTHKPDPPTEKPPKLEKPPKHEGPGSVAPAGTTATATNEVNGVYPDTTIEKEWIIIEDSSNGLTLVSYNTNKQFSFNSAPSLMHVQVHKPLPCNSVLFIFYYRPVGQSIMIQGAHSLLLLSSLFSTITRSNQTFLNFMLKCLVRAHALW